MHIHPCSLEPKHAGFFCIYGPLESRNTFDLVDEGFKTLDHDSSLLVHPYIHPHPLALIIGVIPLLGGHSETCALRPNPFAVC